jgi:hypothetical protein
VSEHELQLNFCDPTMKYAPVHWLLLPVVQSCSAPTPVGHVELSEEVHAGVPSPPFPWDNDDEPQPPMAPDAPTPIASAATATRTRMLRS